jgi:hypothetical protein
VCSKACDARLWCRDRRPGMTLHRLKGRKPFAARCRWGGVYVSVCGCVCVCVADCVANVTCTGSSTNASG